MNGKQFARQEHNGVYHRTGSGRADRLVFWVLLFLCAGAAGASGQTISYVAGDEIDRVSPQAPAMVENVFILVIDGIRNSEAFDDPTHQFIPRIWNDLRPHGTVFSNFICMGYTGTSSGHAVFTSGVTQFMHNVYMGEYGAVKTMQEEPSLFQYLRHQKGVPEEKTWILNGKGVMLYFVGYSWNPFYGDSYQPGLAFTHHHDDAEVLDELNRIIDEHHPALTMVNFPDVDSWGHTENWTEYLLSITRADNIVFEVCKKIWQDPFYKDNTAIIITSDHGRCMDGVNKGFAEHGGSCFGCRRLPFLMMGPNIKKNGEVSARVYQRDLAPTVAAMLGIEADFARGRVLREAFENPPPPEPSARLDPAIAYGGDRLHLAFCGRSDRSTGLYYAHSDDDGRTWSDVITLSRSLETMWPRITADDDNVAVAWGSARVVQGKWAPFCVAIRESHDNGDSWSDTIYAAPSYTWTRGYLYPDLCYDGDFLNVVWSIPFFQEANLTLSRLQGSELVDVETLTAQNMSWPRCASSSSGVHVVYQNTNLDDKRDEIHYCLYADGEWGTPVSLTGLKPSAYRPDIVVDGNGIHAVWAEANDYTFRVMVRNSLDGVNWDTPKSVSVNSLGAWHPRIEAFSQGLVLVWEGYDGKTPAVFTSMSCDGGATWSAPEQLSPPGIKATFPALCVNGSDSAQVIWMKGPAPTGLDSASVQF